MADAQRHILKKAGFRTTFPRSEGITCPACSQQVSVTPFGYIETHQDGRKQCKKSNANHFKMTLHQLQSNRWIKSPKPLSKKQKKQLSKPKKKKKKPGQMTNQDRFIYATGRITFSGGGLPTLGRGR